MTLRIHRLNEAIEHEVSRILRTFFREESSKITIVGALVAPDLTLARVKFSVLGEEKDTRSALKFFSSHRIFIKQKIGLKLQLRTTPDLKFELTDAIAKGNDVIDILNELEIPSA